ncbi:MAG: D-glucuronyl C5-epimerase family protein [Nitrososphaeraceae archaeon]|nr:D-glucuronyl C5-epimerase family protein [Nitrososphaeraceae archaeon]
MQEEYKHIRLSIGDVNWDSVLGHYYIDFRNMEVNYLNNIYDGGFDEEGVPYLKYDKNNFYSPVNVAQYALLIYSKYLYDSSNDQKEIFLSCVNKLVKTSVEKDNVLYWYYYHDSQKYSLKTPWISGMAQGQIISVLLRAYELTGNMEYIEMSKKAFSVLNMDVSIGGARRLDKNGDLWYEEYPSPNEGSYVLNGFIYALFGVIDLYRITKERYYLECIQKCRITLVHNLFKFDAGYWSYYDLKHKELVRFYYQINVHALQMEVLFQLFELKLFSEYALKWRKNANKLNFVLVQIMYRVLPRWRRIRRMF